MELLPWVEVSRGEEGQDVPWSWLRKAWLSSCTSSAQAGLPAHSRSLCCPEESRCCSGQMGKKAWTGRRKQGRRQMWHMQYSFHCITTPWTSYICMYKCSSQCINVHFSLCSAFRAGTRRCAATEGSSWQRRWRSGRAWLEVLSHLSVGRKNSIRKRASQIHLSTLPGA